MSPVRLLAAGSVNLMSKIIVGVTSLVKGLLVHFQSVTGESSGQFDLPILPQVKPLTIAGIESAGIVVPPVIRATEQKGNLEGERGAGTKRNWG